ncbi:MAG: DUF4373 domain-containing protein [Sulfurimonas sp.]|jgi:hypothetical protein
MKEAFYFPHFIGARNDRKIKRVRRDYGIEGYALYFMLLETLREEQELTYPMEDIDILAADFGTSEAKLRSLIMNYNLFSIRETEDGHMFFSPKQIQYLESYFNRRELSRLNGIKSGIARRKQAELLVLELSDKDSTKQVFNNSSAGVELRTKERKKETKEEKKETLSQERGREERDILSNLQDFKRYFIDKNTNTPFTTQGIGYEASTPFKINESGYIENMINSKILTKEEALKVWEYLLGYYRGEKLKSA